MYRFNNMRIIPNDDGMVLTDGKKDVQVYLGKIEEYLQLASVSGIHDMSKEDLLRRAKRGLAEGMLPQCTVRATAQLALDCDFDGLVKFFQKVYEDRFAEDDAKRKRKSPLVLKMEKDLDVAYKIAQTSYDAYRKDYARKNGFKRKKVDFTIGSSKVVHTYSYGAGHELLAPLEIGLDIFDNLMYLDEYDGLDTIGKAMDFAHNFGYDCDRNSELEKVISTIVEFGNATGLSVTCDNPAVGAWRGNGIGDGDEWRVMKGLLPEGDAEYNSLYITIVWKEDGKEEEMLAGFYSDDESPEDDPKDDSIFYYFEDGEAILGDMGDFVVTAIRWE